MKKLFSIAHNFLSLLYIKIDKIVNSRWHKNPFGDELYGTISEYQNLFEEASNNLSEAVRNYEQKLDCSIDENWFNDLAYKTQIVMKSSELNYDHGRVLYSTLMNYLKTNFSDRVNVVETGTARGFSALCMAKALHDNNREGLIVTCDILPHFNKMIWNCIDDHDGPKSRAEILEPWRYLASKYILFHQGYAKIELPKIQFDRVHFAFLDGAHNYDDILSEFEAIKDKQLAGDVIVFDDYNTKQFPGLVKAVDEICLKYTYNRNDINPASDRKYVVATKY